MKALKYILFLLLIFIIGFAIYIAIQPNNFEVKRERTINAPAAVVYNNVIDFKNWKNWSPWIEADPTMEVTPGASTKGIGGSQSWVGKDGIGSMKTIATTANASIEQELQIDTYEPSKITWTFEPTTNGETKVTWKMNSEKVPFMFKGFAAISGGFDNMIGPDFERGLEKLDSVVKADIEKYSITIHGITEHGGGYYLYNTTSCKITDLENTMHKMMTKVSAYTTINNIKMAGAPFTNYHKWDEENNTVMFSSCVPTTDKVITAADSDILTGQLNPFKAVKTTLKGDYKNLKETWDKDYKYIPENNLEFTDDGPTLEVYPTDPVNTPNPANWITEIYIAIK